MTSTHTPHPTVQILRMQAEEIATQRNIIRCHEREIKAMKEHVAEILKQRNDLMQALSAYMHPDDRGTAK